MDRETLAMALFAKWSLEGCGFPERDWEEPEWDAYKAGGDLNPVNLTKKNFLEEADWLLGIVKPHITTTPLGG